MDINDNILSYLKIEIMYIVVMRWSYQNNIVLLWNSMAWLKLRNAYGI